MAIDPYRTIRVVAGHANETIMPIRLSADDHDGRRILFELWDGAQAVASSGLSAKLLYTTADGTGGYTNLTTTTSNGTAAFSGPFPTEIFAQRRGALAVAVSSGQDVIATLRVPFEVDEAIIDEDSPAAQDALSEFRAAVAQLDQLLPATTSRLGTVKVGDGLSAAEDGTLSVAPASLPSAVPIEKGGTGQTTAKAAQYALTNTAAEQTAAAADDTYVLTAHTSASAANGFVAKGKLSKLWAYIADKIRSVFGFSSANVLPVANGGTGSTTADAARTALDITPANIGALPTSGGEVTGSTRFSGGIVSKGKVIQLQSDNFTSGVDGGSSIAGNGQVQFIDSTGKLFGNIRPYSNAGGRQFLQIYTINDNNVFNALMLGFNADGSRFVGLMDAGPWLEGLGLNTINSSASSQITATSGTTITNIHTAKAGAVLSFVLNFSKSAAMTAGTTYDVGTLISGLRPYVGSFNVGTTNPNDTAWVTTGGIVRYKPAANVSAGTNVNITGTYVVA